MKRGQQLAIAGLTGLVVFTAVELWQVKSILDDVDGDEGADVDTDVPLPPVLGGKQRLRLHLQAPSSGGKSSTAVILGPKATATKKRMHFVAGGSALVGALVVGLLANE